MKIVLVRHGYTKAYDESIYAGSLDTPLSISGIEDIKKMAGKYTYPKTDMYFTSGMLRANQTFELLYPDCQLDGIIPNFKEHDGGPFEGKDRKEGISYHPSWLEGKTVGNQESYKDFEARVISSLKDLYNKYHDKSVTIVTHAGVIRVIYSYLRKVSPQRQNYMRIRNGGYYIFEVTKEDDELTYTSFESFDNLPIYNYDDFKFVVIRHGLTNGNVALILTGCDVEYFLTEKGIKQLEERQRTIDYPKTDMYFTSPMIRAKDTFRILYPGVKSNGEIYDLRELSFGRYEAVSLYDIDFYGLFNEWLEDSHDMGFERYHKFSHRCARGFAELVNRCGDNGASSATLVCHMGTMRGILINIEKLNKFTYNDIQANNGGGHIVNLSINSEGYTILKDEDI